MSQSNLTTVVKNNNVESIEIVFKELDEPQLSKTILIILSVILSVLCILGYFGIVWFERFGSDLKRICINRIMSSLSWTIIVWYIAVQPLDILLYFYRPLPELFCLCFSLVKHTLIVQCILFYDSIIIVRFVLIFCLKAPQNFKDDFWYCFINIYIVIFRLLAKVMCFLNDLV